MISLSLSLPARAAAPGHLIPRARKLNFLHLPRTRRTDSEATSGARRHAGGPAWPGRESKGRRRSKSSRRRRKWESVEDVSSRTLSTKGTTSDLSRPTPSSLPPLWIRTLQEPMQAAARSSIPPSTSELNSSLRGALWQDCHQCCCRRCGKSGGSAAIRGSDDFVHDRSSASPSPNWLAPTSSTLFNVSSRRRQTKRRTTTSTARPGTQRRGKTGWCVIMNDDDDRPLVLTLHRVGPRKLCLPHNVMISPPCASTLRTHFPTTVGRSLQLRERNFRSLRYTTLTRMRSEVCVSRGYGSTCAEVDSEKTRPGSYRRSQGLTPR